MCFPVDADCVYSMLVYVTDPCVQRLIDSGTNMSLITLHVLHTQSIFKHATGVLCGAKVILCMYCSSAREAIHSTDCSGTNLRRHVYD